jgi:hypothetical protein
MITGYYSKRNNYRTRHSTRQRAIKDYTNNVAGLGMDPVQFFLTLQDFGPVLSSPVHAPISLDMRQIEIEIF